MTCSLRLNINVEMYISFQENSIGGVMVSVLATSAVDCGFEP